MKKILTIAVLIVALILTAGTARAWKFYGYEENEARSFPSPSGNPAFVITGNSNTFATDGDTAKYLSIKISVGLHTEQTTFTLTDTGISAGILKEKIDAAEIPFLRTACIPDKDGNDYLALIVYGNTASIQIVPTTYGAETAVGLTTTTAYTVWPGQEIWDGHNKLAIDSQGRVTQANTGTNLELTSSDTRHVGTGNLGGVVTDSASIQFVTTTIYLYGVEIDNPSPVNTATVVIKKGPLQTTAVTFTQGVTSWDIKSFGVAPLTISDSATVNCTTGASCVVIWKTK